MLQSCSIEESVHSERNDEEFRKR